MEKANKQQESEPVFNLSRKEKTLEFVASAMCFMLLLASFLKVVFFWTQDIFEWVRNRELGKTRKGGTSSHSFSPIAFRTQSGFSHY